VTAAAIVTNKKRPEILRWILAAWCTLVMIFLFVPIGLVILHSFNRGGSFSIWSGHTSTKWWGELFEADKALGVAVEIVAITVVGSLAPFVVRKATGRSNKLVTRWAGPISFLIAIIAAGVGSDWYRDIFRNANLGDALRNSFIAAIGGTAIAVVIGGLAGVALARRPGWWTKPFLLIVFLILVTPEIMDAIALLGWMVRLGGPFNNSVGPLNNGILRLWVGQSLYASAVVTLIVRARLAGLDESLEEAAADLGATPARAFRQITLPLISSALIAGALLSFTLCLDNTVIAQAVSTAGSTTFPVFVLGNLRSTVKPFVGAAAVVLFGLTVLALGFVGVVLKRSGDSSSQIAATIAGG